MSMCNDISVWLSLGLSDKGQREMITLFVNNVVYMSVLTLCFSLTESLHRLWIVLHTSTLKTDAKILGSTASMVHHYRELCSNYSALGIRLNNLQVHILAVLAVPESCVRSPSCQLLLVSIPVGLHAQWIRPGNLSQWPHVLHQDCELISECVLLIITYSSFERNVWKWLNSEIWNELCKPWIIQALLVQKVWKRNKYCRICGNYILLSLALLIVCNPNVCLPIQMQDVAYKFNHILFNFVK